MKILPIALNTFRENVRDKVLYNLVIFAFLLIASSVILGDLSIGQEVKIIVDLGLASISLVGGLIAVFLGIGLVYKEIDRRTLYNIVSKPVERYQFLLGKFLGLLLTLAVNVAMMTAGMYAALLYLTGSWHSSYLNLLPAVMLVFAELVLLTSIALFFSTFSTPVLSAVFTLSLWFAGHFNSDFKHLSALTDSTALNFLCNLFYYLLPNFSNFKYLSGENIIRTAGYFRGPDVTAYVMAVMYGAVYTIGIFLCAVFVFQRRDFR
jgi:ABC-type transport system involved in multi-copper enzyme maturation permease subunit